MKNRKPLIAGSAIALGFALATPLRAQEVCITNDGATTAPSGTATQTASVACGAGAVAGGDHSVALGNNASAGGRWSTAVGYLSSSGGYASTAIGEYANSSGTESVAIGGLAHSGGFASTAVGNYANAAELGSVAIGAYTNATADISVAIGWLASDEGYRGSVALGALTRVTAVNQVNVGGRTIGGVANGRASDDAATVGQMQAADALLQNQIDSISAAIAGTQVVVSSASAGGTKPTALDPTDTAYLDVNSTGGTAASATGTDAIAFGNGAVASHDNSIALGAGSVTTANNQVNVGGRTISGVAAGEVSATSTDAVNGSQLFATNNRLDALELMAVDIDADLRKLDRRLDGSTAIAIAMSGNAFLPDRSFNITGNVGSYEGAFAGALQIGAVVSPNAAFNAGIATNFNKKGGVGARAGFTFGW